MEKRHYKIYTKEDDLKIIEAVKRNPQNLKKAFTSVAKRLKTTLDSVSHRYYRVIAKNQSNKLFLTVSNQKKSTNYKIYRKGMKAKPERNKKSKWKKILEILFS